MGGFESDTVPDYVNLRDQVFLPVMETLALTLIGLVPLVTMRVFAEERARGTDELLATTLLTPNQIVAGKLIADLRLRRARARDSRSCTRRPRSCAPDSGSGTCSRCTSASSASASRWPRSGSPARPSPRSQLVAAISAYAIAFVLYDFRWMAQFLPEPGGRRRRPALDAPALRRLRRRPRARRGPRLLRGLRRCRVRARRASRSTRRGCAERCASSRCSAASRSSSRPASYYATSSFGVFGWANLLAGDRPARRRRAGLRCAAHRGSARPIARRVLLPRDRMACWWRSRRAVALERLAMRADLRADLTADDPLHDLAPATRAAIDALPGPLVATLYVDAERQPRAQHAPAARDAGRRRRPRRGARAHPRRRAARMSIATGSRARTPSCSSIGRPLRSP